MARRALLTIALVGLLAAAATPAGATVSKVGVTEDKDAMKYGFAPAEITVAVGDTVEFVNDGAEEHDFTALDETFASPIVPPGGTFAFTFTVPGSFRYYCTFHENQEGIVTVNAAVADNAGSGGESGSPGY